MITGNNYVEAPLEFRKQDIHETLQELLDDLKPIEFESYQDYFLINTFKKGISESGKVDIERLRSGGHAVYYQRVKRKRKSKGSSKEDEEISNPSRSSSKARSASDNNGSSSEEDDDDDSDYGNDNNRNKKKSGSNIDPNTNISESGSADSNFFNGNISKSSIIPAPVKGNVRRSSRLSLQQQQQLEKQKQIRKHQKQGSEEDLKKDETGDTNDFEEEKSDICDDSNSKEHIKDLFETLVEKVIEPKRRSDWVLPPRLRYQPEKQMRTKPAFDSVKINEVMANKSIRHILSRFEGGVAGVRKREWPEEK